MLKLSSDQEELQPTETEAWKCQIPNSILEKLSNDLFFYIRPPDLRVAN